MGGSGARERAVTGRRLAPAGLAIVALALLLPRPAPAAESPIQPGAQVIGSASWCTLNFVFARGADRYIGTAGHCTVAPGERMRTGSGEEFGTVVFRQNSSDLDFALIEVDAGKRSAVNPAVRAWGGPTGVAAASETLAGDTLLFHGYGAGFGLTRLTRPRTGALVHDDASSYEANMAAVPGDSGAPVVHAATGKALGIVSRFNAYGLPPSTDAGPTVAHIISRLAGAGWTVTLVTAPY